MFSIRKSNSKGLPINEEIKFAPTKTVRVVGPESEQLGLMQFSNARKSAFDQETCAYRAAGGSPVCRIMDYGVPLRATSVKKKRRKAGFELKEIQLTCQIDTNDFNTKVTTR